MSNTDQIIEINAATVKLPTFTSSDPYTWFVRSEAQFRSKNITRSQTKSDFILQALPEDVCTRISAFLRKNPTDIDYNNLKSEVLKKYSLQASTRVQRVMEMISQPLGERTPTAAWEEMNRLLQLDEIDEHGNFKEVDLKRELWLLHLPEPIRASLHDSSTLPIENLLTKADNLQISNRAILQRQIWKSNIGSISSEDKPMMSSEPINTTPNEGNISFVKTSRREFENTNRFSPKKYSHSNGICYYHNRWGDKARSCVAGCSWKSHSKNGPTAPSGARTHF